MIVYRLTKGKYALDLSGVGASLYGYRWNSKGIKVVYTASSRALAMAEVLVHLPVDLIPDGYQMLEIEIPDSVFVEVLDESVLKEDWNGFPHKEETRILGDEFFRANHHCVLKVPSAVVKGDYNYLINPNHSDMKKIKIVEVNPFPFDDRLFKSK